MKPILVPTLLLSLSLPFLPSPDPDPSPACARRPCCASERASADEADELRAAPTLDRIRALEGDWYEVEADGRVSDRLVATYRTTASGTAVLQTIFPGAEEEMLTVFHQDGDDLVSTHYCMLGNQPRYLARNGERGDDLVFECRGVGNLDGEGGTHMHHGEYRFEGPDRMRSIWRMTENGAETYVADHALARR